VAGNAGDARDVTLTHVLDRLPDLPLDELKDVVGGKAANLGVMLNPELRLPVPPGFAITTEACRAFLAGGWPDGLDDEVRERTAEVEAAVGRRFGSSSDPLLVSVRSGAPVSMPGMMDTILNLGLSDATEPGLAAAAGDESFAADCRARLRTVFREIVGAEPPEDPWQQLRLAIEAVFRSWNSDRAKAYRAKEGIPDDLGTAVTVQAMVFGNLGANSATGVVFTRNPATGAPGLYGDVLFDAQGEDVVAGTHATEPVGALDERLPVAATALREAADRLERHYADLCDIEFTIERGRLWMLQVRVGKRSPQAALRMAVEMAEDPSFPLSRTEAVERVASLLVDPPKASTGRSGYLVPLTTGLGASPGVATGVIATTPEAAARVADGGADVILVRAETSPDDVHGMARAAGILTARGGLASHAAVVARGWGIPAVVGASAVEVGKSLVRIADRELREGETISIDGSSGEVFAGAIPSTTEIVPEARTLLEWARELGIAIDEAFVPNAAPPSLASERKTTPDDCLRAIAIKGFAQTQAVADAVLATTDVVQPILDQLQVEGLTGTVAGAHRLTDAGTARAAELLAAELGQWGIDAAGAALNAFIALDHRVKDVVTASQLRDDGNGVQVPNDHTDADYEAAVLDRLAEIHAHTMAWLTPVAEGCPRLADYGVRLGRALDAARAGDGRFVASPRVDSYHGIWFELHEDLIQLAGRTRSDEVAAGRA
jgi:pyruvate,orthophosphate dikinase